MPTASVVRIQISGSGAFSEPNNGVELFPFTMPASDGAKVTVVGIPGSSADVIQVAGSDAKQSQVSALTLGTYAIAKKQKEQALDNIIWHTSSASWRGRPSTVSYILSGVTQESFLASLLRYEISPRRGRPKLFDVSVDLVRIP